MSKVRKILVIIVAFLVVLNIANWALGQEAVIVAPIEAPAGYPVILETTGSNGSQYEWGVIPASAARGLIPIDNGHRLVFASPVEGPYVFTLSVDRKAATNHFLTLTDGGPSPDPPPPPPPGVLAKFVIVEETDAHRDGGRTPEQAAVILSLGWSSRLKAANIQWDVLDQNAPSLPKDLAEAVKVAVVLGLPAVVCLDASGNVIGMHPLPVTEDAIGELVGKYGVK